ncbi:MAG: hypothetical protein SGPRY_007846 [Prymnesium sp.]
MLAGRAVGEAYGCGYDDYSRGERFERRGREGDRFDRGPRTYEDEDGNRHELISEADAASTWRTGGGMVTDLAAGIGMVTDRVGVTAMVEIVVATGEKSARVPAEAVAIAVLIAVETAVVIAVATVEVLVGVGLIASAVTVDHWSEARALFLAMRGTVAGVAATVARGSEVALTALAAAGLSAGEAARNEYSSVERRKLQLAPRTKPVEPSSAASNSGKSNPFGGAKPVQTKPIEDGLARVDIDSK